MPKRFIPIIMFMFGLTCLCFTASADDFRGHTKHVVREKFKKGPKGVFKPGPKEGERVGKGFHKPWKDGKKFDRHHKKPWKDEKKFGGHHKKHWKDEKKFGEHHKKHWKDEKRFDKHHKKHWKDERKFGKHHKKHWRDHRRLNEERGSIRGNATTPVDVTVREYDDDESTSTKEMIKEKIGSIIDNIGD